LDLPGQHKGWIEQRTETVRARIAEFDAHGNLTPLAPTILMELAELLDQANNDCLSIVDEFETQRPSASWFWINAISGYGGLALIDPTFISAAIAIGGALGASKSLYDRARFLVLEQRYLSLYWDVQLRKSALGSELIRRGISWPTTP
jgi:hypothetical protein